MRLSAAEWQARATEHEDRADALTAGHRERKLRGEKHPIEDFLWHYYSVKPRELRRWHPGAGVVLEGADRGSWRHYMTVATAPNRSGSDPTDNSVTTSADSLDTNLRTDSFVDLSEFFATRGGTVDYVENLLSATLERTPRYGCFGLHEWAMVYRMTPEQLRHSALPLRIGHEATDLVVEQHPIACTHFDAFRFFTPEAAPLNTLQPTRETQPELEQSGCLHAGMDVYKWASKLGPIVPGEVLLDTFELARDIRVVDMQASPYDVSSLGLAVIPIETPEGKREYSRLQRGFAERGNGLRERVLEAIAAARALEGSQI
ncbi:3-methyladenine DNA glycosylase [Leucobacter coleopterorum]|uniref:3-methyladenine DNA glycosylase n=1 Tax=Leucobacter coleopterorum TaxID=2714933 RepID=A0ABX6K463_9MICO|nr:3-methyladenine DNA glycosylase [Leucobacter coleopterorum]